MEKELLKTVIQSWDAYKRYLDETYVGSDTIPASKLDNLDIADEALMNLMDAYSGWED